MYKRIITLGLCCLLVLGMVAGIASSTSKVNASPVFAYGTDIGWLKQLEDEGVTFQNDAGIQGDPLQILKDHGVNSVRLRVFVNPPSNYYWYKDNTTWTMLGYSDKAGVLAAAQRAKTLGLRVMVDFHYSDVFADPGHQYKPTAWSGYTVNQISTAIYDHTYDVLSALKNVGVTPEWVQVGNESDPGIVLPEGAASNTANLVKFLNSGYDAVKAVSPTSKVVTHLADGGNNENCRYWFDKFINNGGKTDVIGVSYYPYWHNKPYWEYVNNLKTNLNDMASRYNKEVMVVEVGGLENKADDAYWTVRGAIDAVKSVPNNKGIGVFYWEPAVHSSVLPDGYPLGATMVVSDKVLKFTTAIDAFTDSQTRNLIANSSFETGSYVDWNIWTNNNDNAIYVEGSGNSGAYRLTHWKSTAYQASTYQTFTGLTNGSYTLKAWIKNGGGQTTCQLFAKNYGGSERTIAIPVTNTWTQVTITNINVTNNTCMVGLWSVAGPGNWVSIDDVEFIKN